MELSRRQPRMAGDAGSWEKGPVQVCFWSLERTGPADTWIPDLQSWERAEPGSKPSGAWRVLPRPRETRAEGGAVLLDGPLLPTGLQSGTVLSTSRCPSAELCTGEMREKTFYPTENSPRIPHGSCLD